MFRQKYSDQAAVIRALNKSYAIIEFSPDGRILTANDRFLAIMGYRREEIAGRHHSIFCEPSVAARDDYGRFWQHLAEGKFQSGAFRRIGKGGRPVWLQATYNPVLDASGRVIRIVSFSSDITEAKIREIDFASKVTALDRAQATIEFTPTGEILTANENFLSALGYCLEEIQGRHHQMFCDPEYVRTSEYRQFWDRLARGEFIVDEFRRIGKKGQSVYIQASYNPVMDEAGVVIKVVKFATDVTTAVGRRLTNDQIGHEIDGRLDDVLAQIDDASHMASGASTASTRTSSMVNAVASSAEELTASVRDIAENMATAQTSIEGVFRHAESATTFASTLSESAKAMTNVVDFIHSIASQINLLALNATIESARAGDAGKGFAVVASEVKTLANQASSSTKAIGEEIARIQTVSIEVVGALDLISNSMTQVIRNVSIVATAITQQHAVTNEISDNMQAAVAAVQEIEDSLSRINTAFGSVVVASIEVKDKVDRLVA